ncbi:hypothetical protein ACWEO2_41195 [Nocardia sp. NPDC004278]
MRPEEGLHTRRPPHRRLLLRPRRRHQHPPQHLPQPARLRRLPPRALLANTNHDTHAEHEHAQRISALRHAITDTETKIKRLVRSLELVDEPDQELIRDIGERRTQLREHLAQLQTQLADAETQQQQQPNPTLIDALPTGDINQQLPEHLARDVFQALQLEIRYNKTTNRVRYRITLTGTTLDHVHRTAATVMALRPRTGRIGSCGAQSPRSVAHKESVIAEGTALAGGPPHRSQRALLTHWAPALGPGAKAHLGKGMYYACRR